MYVLMNLFTGLPNQVAGKCIITTQMYLECCRIVDICYCYIVSVAGFSLVYNLILFLGVLLPFH